MLLRRLLFSQYFVLYLSAAYLVLGWAVIPGALSSDNLANIFSNLLPLLVVAIGETYVLIGAGIDLSVTSIIGLASIAGGLVMSADGGALAGSPWAAAVGVAVMLAAGLGLGVANGLAITLLEMPPFMVTLTTMMGAGGAAIWLTRSRNLYHLPRAFDRIGEMPWPLAVVLGVAVAAHLFLERGLPGRWLYAVGYNPRTALASGVPVRGVIVASYAVSGLCAAIASILYTARLETASPVLGQRLLLDAIAAVVIGGTSLFGGRGRVPWTVFGALLITVIDNSLSLLGLSNFMVLMVKGMVVLLAAILDAARRRALAV